MKKGNRYGKILGLMKERGLTQSEVAERASFNICTLNAKLNGKYEFTADEISRLSTALEIPSEDIGAYFFVQGV